MLPTSVVYQRDPVLWIRRFLRVTLTDDQIALCEAVVQHPRVIGQSAHACGKTLAGAAIALWFLFNFKDSEVILTSSSMWQVRERMFAEVERLYRGASAPLGGTLTKTQILLGPKWKLSAVATDNPSNIQGGHSPHQLVVIDEAQAVEPPIWEACESMLSGSHCRMLATLNPLFASGPAYERTRKPDQWKVVKLSAWRHPNILAGKALIPGAITQAWIDDIRRTHGESSPYFVARVRGEYPETSDDTVVTLADLERCANLDHPLVGDGYRLGVDVARFGGDRCWAVLTCEGTVVGEWSWNGLDLMATVGRVCHLIEEFELDPERVSIDGAGVGGGVIDRLREADLDVNDVNFGSRVCGDWSTGPYADQLALDGVRLLNRKAELYWVLRTLLKSKRLCVPRRFERIWTDLVSTRFDYHSDGSIRVEDKTEQRRRNGRSPDAGDALIISLCRLSRPLITFIS